MNSSKFHLLLIFTTLLWFSTPTICQPEFTAYNCDDEDGNFTITSQYSKNLHTLLSSITSNNQVNYGFYNLSIGEKLNTVYGVALCRGDIPVSDCKTCINYATTKISLVCPNQMTAIGWYETCMLRYSNQDIFKGEMSQPRYNLTNGEIAANTKSFNKTVSNLMLSLANKAALGDSRLKFATGEAQVSSKLRVYALLQCIPDLEAFDCLNCLTLIINYALLDCCYGELGVRAAGATCNIRYDNYRFYKSAVELPPVPQSLAPPPLSLPSPSPKSMTSKTGNRNKRIRVAVGSIIPTVAILMIIIGLLSCYLRRRKTPLHKIENDDEDSESEMIESLQLDFNTVKAATDNFANTNKLGQGGFGAIYKGIMPSTGEVIAVKRLSSNSEQGDEEFKSEAFLVAKLQHRNLVKCLGYCVAKDERLLVYEFVPNKSLDLFLFDPIKRMRLDWVKRYNIIGGISRGFLYLHEDSRLLVVHRDLKPGNVLLDAEMNPKISDFGMARLFSADQSHANTSKIAGTYGYMPPEYVVHGRFSIKTDVFSFGVLVLEIISGEKVSKFSQTRNGESLLSFAWRNWLEGNALNLVDSTILDLNTTEVLRCMHIGLLCVQENAAQRPIMSSVVLMLNSHSLTLPVPSRPAFLVQNDMDSDVPVLDCNSWHIDGSIKEASVSSIAPR